MQSTPARKSMPGRSRSPTGRNSRPARGVFGVGYDKIYLKAAPNLLQPFNEDVSARFADDVADHENARRAVFIEYFFFFVFCHIG